MRSRPIAGDAGDAGVAEAMLLPSHRGHQRARCAALGSWARGFGISLSPGQLVVATTFGLLCAPSQHSPEGLAACMRFLGLFLHLDDLERDAFVAAEAELRRELEAGASAGGDATAFADLCRDLGPPERAPARFRAAFLDYLDALREEEREDLRRQSPDACHRQRMRTIATDVNLSLWVEAEDIPVPPSAAARELWAAGIELTYLCNDLFSEEKDRAALSGPHPEANLVLALERGYIGAGDPAARARAEVVGRYNRRTEDFARARAELADHPRYGDMCARMVDGNLASHRHTQRLRFAGPHGALEELEWVEAGAQPRLGEALPEG